MTDFLNNIVNVSLNCWNISYILNLDFHSSEFNILLQVIGIFLGALFAVICCIFGKIWHKYSLHKAGTQHGNKVIKCFSTPGFKISILFCLMMGYTIGSCILPFNIFPNLEYIKTDYGWIKTFYRGSFDYYFFLFFGIIATLYFFVIASYILILTNKRIIISIPIKSKYAEILLNNIKTIHLEKQSIFARVLLFNKHGKEYYLGPYFSVKNIYNFIRHYLSTRIS